MESMELSLERFEAVVQSITDGVLTVDREWRITCFNRAAEEITGYSREAVLGRPCYEVLRSDLCRDACPMQHTLDTGTPVAGVVVYITDAEDRQIPISVSTALYRDREGRLKGGVGTFRDLRQVEALKKRVVKNYTFRDIITRSPRVFELLDTLPAVAESGSTVLIQGETGVGKELLARAIHDLSDRQAGPFVPVNCACFPETLVDSELFGYEKGAFTGADRAKVGRFARAQDGTLFLDEIGNLPLPVQGKLLRVLQDHTYEPLGATRERHTNARIVAATNQDLAAMVEDESFRQDLYYRVNVIELELPPLRERPEDVMPLVRHFLEELALVHDKRVNGMTPEALRVLTSYEYPGNIRELENIVEHGFVMAKGPLIDCDDLPPWLPPESDVAPRQRLDECERRVIVAALERNAGNRAATADELGIHKSTLYRRIHRLGLSLEEDGH